MMHSANPYLTAKTVTRKKLDVPILLICAVFAGAVAPATVKMFLQGKTLSGVFGILMFAALITPIYRILRHAYNRLCARRIAEALLPLTDESLSFHQLSSALPVKNALQTLKNLIGKGYLQNLRIDGDTRSVALYVPEGAFVQWVCPNCGAKNRSRRGRSMRCKYCDQPLAEHSDG